MVGSHLQLETETTEITNSTKQEEGEDEDEELTVDELGWGVHAFSDKKFIGSSWFDFFQTD